MASFWPRFRNQERGQWVPEAVRDFSESFNRRKGPWRCEPAAELFLLPENRFLVPDFALKDEERGRRVLLEHIQYPDPERLRIRLDLLDSRPSRIQGTSEGLESEPEYLLACRGRPALLPLQSHPRLFTYRRSLTVTAVLEWLEHKAGRSDIAAGQLPSSRV